MHNRAMNISHKTKSTSDAEAAVKGETYCTHAYKYTDGFS